jgi:hypothetical protein
MESRTRGAVLAIRADATPDHFGRDHERLAVLVDAAKDDVDMMVIGIAGLFGSFSLRGSPRG